MAVAVGHQEIRQPLADGRHLLVGAVLPDALHQLVVGRLEIRKQLARLAEIEFEARGKRCVKHIRLLKCLAQRLLEGFRFGQKCLLEA